MGHFERRENIKKIDEGVRDYLDGRNDDQYHDDFAFFLKTHYDKATSLKFLSDNRSQWWVEQSLGFKSFDGRKWHEDVYPTEFFRSIQMSPEAMEKLSPEAALAYLEGECRKHLEDSELSNAVAVWGRQPSGARVLIAYAAKN